MTDHFEDDETQPVSSIDDRRNAMSKPTRTDLYPDRLELIEDGKLIRRIYLNQVKTVRMAIELAGQDTQVVCRIYGSSGHIVIGSRAFDSPGRWTNNAIIFRTFVLNLHIMLGKQDQPIRYIEGQTLMFRIILSTLGGAIAGLALVYMIYMSTEQNSAMLAFAGLPGVLIGGYLMWVFRPSIPMAYDPDGLIKRFEAPPDSGASRGDRE